MVEGIFIEKNASYKTKEKKKAIQCKMAKNKPIDPKIRRRKPKDRSNIVWCEHQENNEGSSGSSKVIEEAAANKQKE